MIPFVLFGFSYPILFMIKASVSAFRSSPVYASFTVEAHEHLWDIRMQILFLQ